MHLFSCVIVGLMSMSIYAMEQSLPPKQRDLSRRNSATSINWRHSQLVAYRKASALSKDKDELYDKLSQTEKGLTLLSNEELVCYILKNNIENLMPHARELAATFNSWTDLHRAVAFHDVLPELEDVTKRTRMNRQTALHFAVNYANYKAAEALLKSDPGCIDLKDIYGNTPLSLACRQGDARMIELLVQYKASCPHQNAQGQTPLHNVIQSESVEALRALSPCSDDALHRALGTYDKQNHTPLHDACERGWLEGAQMLIKLGAVPDARSIDTKTGNSVGSTPLHLLCSLSDKALTDDHLKIAALLIEKGDIDKQGIDQQSPLHVACACGSIRMTHFLVNQKASEERLDGKGHTPAQVAFLHKQWKLLKDGEKSDMGTAQLCHAQ